MKPGGTPIGEIFHLMTQSYVVFDTEQEYVIHFFLSQKTKILEPFQCFFSPGVQWTPRNGLKKQFNAQERQEIIKFCFRQMKADKILGKVTEAF